MSLEKSISCPVLLEFLELFQPKCMSLVLSSRKNLQVTIVLSCASSGKEMSVVVHRDAMRQCFVVQKAAGSSHDPGAQTAPHQVIKNQPEKERFGDV